jgi:hypothetical protein
MFVLWQEWTDAVSAEFLRVACFRLAAQRCAGGTRSDLHPEQLGECRWIGLGKRRGGQRASLTGYPEIKSMAR